MPNVADQYLADIQELKELLTEVNTSLLAKEDELANLVRDAKKWDELSRLITELRTPVRELKASTEILIRKAESLIDDVALAQLLQEAIATQNVHLENYLEKANASVLKVAADLNNNLKEIITINNVIIQKFSNYIGSMTSNKSQEDLLHKKIASLTTYMLVGLLAATIVPLFVVYTVPPVNSKHTRVLDALYERLFPLAPKSQP